jgi:hypothetical protein
MKPSLKRSLTRLSSSIDLALFLIREELKSRRFFNTLREAGIEDVYYQPQLDKAIFVILELEEDNEETFKGYTRIMEDHAMRIRQDSEVIQEEAVGAYEKLVELKKGAAL